MCIRDRVYFANDIYQLVSAPLISKMPVGATMIATDVASPFFTPIKLTFMVSVILSVPIILYQVWAFVAPALYKQDVYKRQGYHPARIHPAACGR